MSLSHRLHVALFWTLTALALGGLAPCLILPAWTDYQQALRLQAVRRNSAERLTAEVAGQQKQIAHLQNDVAYRERVLYEEVGIDPPGIETILVDRRTRPRENNNAAVGRLRRSAPIDDDIFPALTAVAESAMDRYPNWTHVFVLDQTRPLVMGMSGALLISTILLLGGRPRKPL